MRGGGDVIRLEALLRYAMNRKGWRDRLSYGSAPMAYNLVTHALDADDFLSVRDRGLLGPYDPPACVPASR
jgi:hypothetical protein